MAYNAFGGGGGGRNDQDNDRKIFVGSLNDAPHITKEVLTSYFQTFGPVEEAKVIYDRNTDQPRGFAFVTLEKSETQQQILAQSEHYIQEHKVVVKPANSGKGGQSRAPGGGANKIYCRDVPTDKTEADITHFFCNYDPQVNVSITKVDTPTDRDTQMRKNFIFVTFDSEATAKYFLDMGSITWDGAQISISSAHEKTQKRAYDGGFGGGRGYGDGYGESKRGGYGGGFGRGGYNQRQGYGGGGYGGGGSYGGGGYGGGAGGYGGGGYGGGAGSYGNGYSQSGGWNSGGGADYSNQQYSQGYQGYNQGSY